MKSLTAGKCSRTLSGVFVACLAFAAQGSTNVFNDAVFWFRGGKDLNGDGYMRQQGEFFDDLHANDPAHDNHKMTMSSEYYTGDSAGYKINARLDEEQVSFPALGTNIINTMKVLRISNVKGNNKYFPFDVNPHPMNILSLVEFVWIMAVATINVSLKWGTTLQRDRECGLDSHRVILIIPDACA